MINKLTASLCFLAASLLFTSTAMAAASTYAGVNYTSIDYDAGGVGDGDIPAIIGRLGRQYNPYLATEFRLGTGLSDETIVGIDLELDSLTGGFLRAGYPVSEAFYPYAIVGYTNVSLSASAFGLSASDGGTDISYGLGFDFNLNKRWSVNAEYINYYTRDIVDIESFSIGFAFRY